MFYRECRGDFNVVGRHALSVPNVVFVFMSFFFFFSFISCVARTHISNNQKGPAAFHKHLEVDAVADADADADMRAREQTQNKAQPENKIKI